MTPDAIPGIDGDPLVYLNGAMTPLSQAKVSVLDRGFIFGDGIYEVVPVYNGKPFRMEQHMARLFRSLASIRIDNPHTRPQWQALVQQVIDAFARQYPAQRDQFVYIQVTRGVAKRDHGFPAGVRPTVFLMSSPFARPAAESREKGIAAVSMKDERWLHCEIKSVSLLGNVLARQYAVDRGVPEVIQFRDGYLTEGSASNIWVVKGGAIVAPPKDNLILEGIRYGLMEELATAGGIPMHVRPVLCSEVYTADELMLSSATKEVLAITTLDGRAVGNGPGTGAPGPVYAKLRAAYDAAIA